MGLRAHLSSEPLPMNSREKFILNNFDLIRLLAALQVACNHAIGFMESDVSGWFGALLKYSYIFPGVPIFFFISGFLISRSYENNPSLKEYSQNRILRLYPALIICVLTSCVLISISGYLSTPAAAGAGFGDMFLLFLAKTTIVQFYNPDFMRGYGDGVLNGSLWTIAVELQFYVMIPVLYKLFGLAKEQYSNNKLLILIAVFFVINRMYVYGLFGSEDSVIHKLVGVSFFPWIYMFLIGVFVQKNFDAFHAFVKGRFIPFFIAYCIFGLLLMPFEVELGNTLSVFLFIPLVFVIMAGAYSNTGLSHKLLNKNDVSYGIYIFHMPIINFMLYHNMKGSLGYPLLAMAVTIVIAIISWRRIEKPSLKLKKHPLNPLYKSQEPKSSDSGDDSKQDLKKA